MCVQKVDKNLVVREAWKQKEVSLKKRTIPEREDHFEVVL